MKSINELVLEEESALKHIRRWISGVKNKNNIIILPANKEADESEILNLQITTKSTNCSGSKK